jgi:multiple sugar transport system substrate-binding protein
LREIRRPEAPEATTGSTFDTIPIVSVSSRLVRSLKAIVLALLIIPALAILLFGPSAGEALPPDRVVVDYWEKWTSDEGAQMKQIVDDFNDTVGKDKHIYVRYVSISAINQKTLIATAAGVPPDVAGLWDVNMVQFASLDALEPLEQMAAEHGITEGTYKPVYWKACHWDGHLYALISTPATIALHYNTKIFHDNAERLRAAGLDADRAPQSVDELDRYAKVLDKVGVDGRIERTGYLPMEPGWYVRYTYFWWGAEIWDATHQKFTLTDPKVLASFDWVQSYSRRLGKDAINEFRSGVAGGSTNWDSPQNPFMTGAIAMEQQGPWTANYVLNLNPKMAGVKSAAEDNVNDPLPVRRARCQWAAAPFPSAVPGLNDVTYATFDTLVIPRGAKHKREAFEFIAYVNEQKVMEKLCKMHSKNSPLAAVSQDFIEHNKNPYIDVFERLAASPNARAAPQLPIMPEVADEIDNAVQRIVLMEATPEQAMKQAQDRLQQMYDRFMEVQRARRAKTIASVGTMN